MVSFGDVIRCDGSRSYFARMEGGVRTTVQRRAVAQVLRSTALEFWFRTDASQERTTSIGRMLLRLAFVRGLDSGDIA